MIKKYNELIKKIQIFITEIKKNNYKILNSNNINLKSNERL